MSKNKFLDHVNNSNFLAIRNLWDFVSKININNYQILV